MLKNFGLVIRCPSGMVGHKMYEANRYLQPFGMIWLRATLRNNSSRAMAKKGRQSLARNILSKRQTSSPLIVLVVGSRKWSVTKDRISKSF
jgi:selenophosphate synthase